MFLIPNLHSIDFSFWDKDSFNWKFLLFLVSTQIFGKTKVSLRWSETIRKLSQIIHFDLTGKRFSIVTRTGTRMKYNAIYAYILAIYIIGTIFHFNHFVALKTFSVSQRSTIRKIIWKYVIQVSENSSSFWATIHIEIPWKINEILRLIYQ